MARLPTPGGDGGTWGNVLNDYLSQVHNADGTLKDNTVTANVLAPNSVSNAAIASNAVNALSIADGSITEALLDNDVQTKLNGSGAAPDWSAITNKPPVIGAGADQAAARTAIGAGTSNVTLAGNGSATTASRSDHAHSKSDVGLGNVDNTSDPNKPISAATQTALNAKAPLASPTFTGIVTVPTPTNGTDATTKAYVDSQVTGSATPDATTSTKGKVQLAGDLGGTAASPTVAKIQGIAVSGTPATGNVLTASSTTAASWTAPPNAPVSSVAGKTGAVTLVANDISDATTTGKSILTVADATTARTVIGAGTASTKADVGLGNVDNTSDATKPVSTSQAAADAAVLASANSHADTDAAPRSRPIVRNRKNLARFETALATKACPVITVIGNSISWGVGSDGTGTTTTGFYETYRQNAWPVLLRKRLASRGGYQPSENFVGLSQVFGYTTNLLGTAAPSLSVGPFGYLATGGGMSLPDSTASMDIAAARLGAFTDLDVLYWGTGSSVGGGYSPQVLIDGVQVAAGGVASTGNLSVLTVSGLTDASHLITLKGTGSNPCWVAGVVPRRSSGIVVNRIATPGSRAVDVSGALTGFSTVQQNRNIDAAVTAGYSDLVIIQFTANEVYQQTPLADYQAALEAIISHASATVTYPATACVLLLGDPMQTNAETGYAIKRSDYLGVMKTISDANPVVAYADMNEVFGDRATGEAMGLWPSGTVHPALEGHRRMADFILDDVLPGATITDTGGIGPTVYTSAEKAKLAGVASGATANSTEAITATASTLAKRDANANLLADNFLAGGTVTAQAGGTTTLTVDSTFAQFFTGSAGQTVALPTTGIAVGQGFLIVNAGIGNVSVSGFGTLLTTQALWVIANTTTPTWSYVVLSSAVLRATATASAAAQRDANANLLANAVLVNGASTVSVAGTTALLVGSAKKQVITGTSTQTFTLPTTSVAAYQDWDFINLSTGTVTINSSGGNLVKTLAAGTSTVVTALQATPTTAAHWYAS
jgi:hypothetical protein